MLRAEGCVWIVKYTVVSNVTTEGWVYCCVVTIDGSPAKVVGLLHVLIGPSYPAHKLLPLGLWASCVLTTSYS